MTPITIGDKDYNFKTTIRSMIAFEQALHKRFELVTLTDIYTYMYCILLSNNDDFTLSFDEFMLVLDENPTLITVMTNIIFPPSEGETAQKKN